MNAPVSLIRRLARVTVGIETRVRQSHPSAAILGAERSGTGTVVDPEGLVLTVNYVVVGAESIEVTLGSGHVYPARLVGQDFRTGIAVLRIEGIPVPCRYPSPRRSETCRPGEDVVVLASLGGEKRRANNGVITAIEPFDAYWEYRLERAIFTTAVNPGLGGAPLFDLRGNLLGIVALDLGQIGRFTLAIPIDAFLDARDELLAHGHRVSELPRAWVGLYCYTERDRVIVAGVLPGSPAEAAGLRPGDVILAVDEQEVGSRADLYRSLWKRRPGERVRFRVYRDRQVVSVEVAALSVEEFFA
ncbi:MAG: PDZ domain-containing protein [Candidatus Binatia bacterium]|nr:MAG: PDZ domain-containing protein [Candidatus Binatia bacterium]